jgi:hypothetical protein
MSRHETHGVDAEGDQMSAPKYEEFLAKLTSGAGTGDDQLQPRTSESRLVAEPISATEGTAATTSVLAPKLERIADKGLDKADQILDLPLDPDNRDIFGPTLRAQSAIVGHALITQVRVDETRLRPRRFDRLPELLRLVAEAEARLPKRPLLTGEYVSPEEEAHLRRPIVEPRAKSGGEPDA